MRSSADGRPGLLFLHGFTGSGASWDPVLEGLETDLPIYRPDLPGHGGAPAADPAAGFEANADRLLAALPGGRLHLVAYSMGARVGISLLARHPRRFRSAILIGAHPGLDSADERLRRRQLESEWAARLEAGGIEAFIADWQRRPLFATQQGADPAVLEAQRRIRLGQSAIGLASALRGLGLGRMPSYLSRLAGLDLPLSWMVGGRDEKFCQIARSARQRLPGTHLEVVAGAGHNLILETPAAVRAAVSKDLERCLTTHES